MSGRVAWLPFESREAAQAAIGPIPDGIDMVPFTDGNQAPGDLSRVELLVLPYMGGFSVLERAGEMSSLRVVQSPNAGVDNIRPLIPAGVQICNAGGVHDAATAEVAIGLALAQGRHLDDYARDMTHGVWQPRWGTGLADQRVLIVGYGNIGQAIEARLQGFETASITRMARTARVGPAADGRPVQIHAVDDLARWLPDTDVVFVIMPLTDQSRGLFDAQMLALLPDNALLVNVARGPVVDTQALVVETSSGRLRAGLDVVDPEPLPPEHPLWHCPNVLISMHSGGMSSSFQPRINQLIGDQLRRFAADEPLANIVE